MLYYENKLEGGKKEVNLYKNYIRYEHVNLVKVVKFLAWITTVTEMQCMRQLFYSLNILQLNLIKIM